MTIFVELLAVIESHDASVFYERAWDYNDTHTHLFNGPLSATTRVSWYQKGKTNLDFTEARDSEWQWHQLGRMQVCTSLQTDNHASTLPLYFYSPDAFPAAKPTVSEHWCWILFFVNTLIYSVVVLHACNGSGRINKDEMGDCSWVPGLIYIFGHSGWLILLLSVDRRWLWPKSCGSDVQLGR